ncbi:MAG: hypothetical protein KAT16_05885 [Candidatus Heimdallarchaeota archaeon]|nr:hypothetical protein [Candidatus Heimdallarchaeota archaeon]
MDIILFLVMLGSGLIILRKIMSSKGKQLPKAAQLEQQGRFLEAVEIYSRFSINEAAEMVLRTPEASQILVLRKIESNFKPRKVERAFLRLARIYGEKKDPQKASRSYLFARKPFAAAKAYIDHGGVDYIPAAIQVLDQNTRYIHDRDQSIRNLAKHAYQNQKFMEAAELLRTIGAEEEANAVLVAAASEMKKHGFDSLAKQYLEIKHPEKAIHRYLDEIKVHLMKGDIEKVRRSLSITKGLIKNLEKHSKQISEIKTLELKEKTIEYDRVLKVIDSASDLLRKKNRNQSIALYEELIESMGDSVPGFVYAEAALANEEQNPNRAISLYRQASELIDSKQAANSFLLRAKNIEIASTIGSSAVFQTSSLSTEDDLEENCSVCRTKISDVTLLVRCPECGSPAHYPHLAEWLKIRGSCPVCKKKITIQKSRNRT